MKNAAPRCRCCGQGGDEGFGLGVDLGHGAGHEGRVQRRAQVGRSVFEHQAAVRPHAHAAFGPPPAVEGQQLHRHGVQHLVADHHAVDGLGQAVQPLHLRRETRQAVGLAFAQRARQVHDLVALHGPAQRVQQLFGQRAAAGAEFDHRVPLTGRQRLAHLQRQRAAKQG